MAFTMHASKNNKISFCCVLIFCFLFVGASYATNHVSEIKQVNLSMEQGVYLLSAEVNYHFSKKAMNALQNGVPLYWIVQIQVQQQRDLLWNKTLTEKAVRYRLQYLALLNMYRLKNDTSGEVYNFYSLASALDKMSTLQQIPLIDTKFITPKEHYTVAIRLLFNRSALPLPLQPIAYLSPQWYLSSVWYNYPLIK